METALVAQYSKSDFAGDVRAGLLRSGQKELPSKYLYDDIGSALFEVISVLPEYGLTRADEGLLRRHATDIVSRVETQVLVAELGSGSGKKTRWILEALARRQRTTYCPIEISPSALARCQSELGQLECVSIVGFERPYLDGLLAAASGRREHEHLLVLFLGSTIGNFDRDAGARFLAEVRRILYPGDWLLLGADLEKPLPQLLAAYNDSIGVTAAFNLNLLARINRELGADFNFAAFRHEARYNSIERRIEMHLRSLCDQTVTIAEAKCTVSFAKDETIWTESSHKYRAEEIPDMARRSGFRCDSQWLDSEWLFAENLLVAE
jgi:dimethylhistidine N-methyltransferase